MLRISLLADESEQRGRSAANWRGLGRRACAACWEHSAQALPSRDAVVDLSDVTFIDESGERLLSEMRTPEWSSSPPESKPNI